MGGRGDDLYGGGPAGVRAGTGHRRGSALLEQQAERIDSLSPTNEPEHTYGLGLAGGRGWIGHNGLISGYTTNLFNHPELDVVVVVAVNNDFLAGDCPLTFRPRRTDRRASPARP